MLERMLSRDTGNDREKCGLDGRSGFVEVCRVRWWEVILMTMERVCLCQICKFTILDRWSLCTEVCERTLDRIGSTHDYPTHRPLCPKCMMT